MEQKPRAKVTSFVPLPSALHSPGNKANDCQDRVLRVTEFKYCSLYLLAVGLGNSYKLF